MKRKIAAILAADIAGYSKLVAEDEEETLHRLAIYRAVFEDFVARYGGRIFNTAGDATLAEFQSAVDAVRCAVDVQESLRTRNLAYAPGRQMSFRIGITIGDIVERDGDLLGDGVNIASRLEALAPEGGICISRGVHEAVTNKVSLKFSDLGPLALKNIPERVHAYAVALAPQGSRRARHLAVSPAMAAVAVALIAAVAAGGYLVTQAKLPFAPTSGDTAPPTTAAGPGKASISQTAPVRSAASTSGAQEEEPASSTAAKSGSEAPAEKTAAAGASSAMPTAAGESREQVGTTEETCRRYLPSIGKTVEVPCEEGAPAETIPEARVEADKETALIPPSSDLGSHPFIGKWSTSSTACDRSAAEIPSKDRVVFFGAANTAQYKAGAYGGYVCRLASIVTAPSGFKYAASCLSGAYLHERHDPKEGQLELDAIGDRLTGLGPDGFALHLHRCN